MQNLCITSRKNVQSQLTKTVHTGKLVFLVAYCFSCSEVPIPNVRTNQATIPGKDSKSVIKKCMAKKQPVPSQSDGCQKKCLTLKEKVEVTQKSNEGNSSRKLAQTFDCGKIQIV